LIGSVGFGWYIKQQMQPANATSTEAVASKSVEKPASPAAPAPDAAAATAAAKLKQPDPLLKKTRAGGIASASTLEWLQDVEKAKAQAIQEKKDVMLVFTGSDWSGPCIQFDRDVLSRPEFEQQVKQQYVPVRLDFPRT